MSEETMLTIKAVLDAKGFEDLDARSQKSESFLRKNISAQRDLAKATLETAKAEREQAETNIKTLSSRLESLEKQISSKRSTLVELQSSSLKAEMGAYQHMELQKTTRTQLNKLEKEALSVRKSLSKETNALAKAIKGESAALAITDEAASKLTNSLNGVTKSATNAMAKVVGVSQKTTTALTKTIQSLSGMSAVIAGPLALALAAAASGVASYVVSTNTADMATGKYSKTIDDLRKKYDELSISTKDAGTRTQEFAEIQQRVIAAKVAEITGELQKLEKSISDAAARALATTYIADGFLGIAEAVEYTTEKGRHYREQIEKIIADQKAGTISAEAAALAIREVEISLDNLQDKDGGIPKKSYDMDNLRRAILALLPLYDALAEKNKELEKFAGATEQQIAAAFKRTTEGTRAALQESIALARKWVAESASLPQAAQEQAKAVLAKAQKDLDDFDKRQADSQKKQGDQYKKTSEGKIVELGKLYEAQQEIARKTIADSQELSVAMAKIDKDYYAKYEKLLRENYAERIAKGKALTDAQISELERVADKNRELALTSDISDLEARYEAQKKIANASIADQTKLKSTLLELEKEHHAAIVALTKDSYEKQVAIGRDLTAFQEANLKKLAEVTKEYSTKTTATEELEEEYRIRKEVASQTIANERNKVAELKRIHKEYLEDMLKLLQAIAESEAAATGSVSEATAKSIEKVRGQIKSLEGDLKGSLMTLGSYLKSVSDSLGDFMSAQYDARINSLDKALERELRMLENAFEQQNALYEEQLKQYENLEERRTEIQEEYDDARERLNWKTQEHVTEDEYQAIMAQMAQEEEKYTESMMRLEEDTLMRDEIRLAQEQAETNYLIRKEEMEKEYAIKRAKLERKQAEQQKITSLFSALINVAQGITLAWAQGGFLLGAVFAAIVAAAGAIQIATIASQPLPSIPSYHIGGLIGGPNIQDYGHVPGPDNPHDKTLLWGQKGEYVLNKRESDFYQRLAAEGITLEGIVRNAGGFQSRGAEEHRLMIQMRSDASIPQSTAVVAPVTHNTQHNTYQVKDRLTFSEARRLQARANRAFLRSLA